MGDCNPTGRIFFADPPAAENLNAVGHGNYFFNPSLRAVGSTSRKLGWTKAGPFGVGYLRQFCCLFTHQTHDMPLKINVSGHAQHRLFIRNTTAFFKISDNVFNPIVNFKITLFQASILQAKRGLIG